MTNYIGKILCWLDFHKFIEQPTKARSWRHRICTRIDCDRIEIFLGIADMQWDRISIDDVHDEEARAWLLKQLQHLQKPSSKSSSLKCPECGGTKFLEGPRGGMAVNVKCYGCGHKMNICPLPDGKYWIVNESI